MIERLVWGPDRVFALDLPGHGARAAEPPPAADVTAYGAALREETIRSAATRLRIKVRTDKEFGGGSGTRTPDTEIMIPLL